MPASFGPTTATRRSLTSSASVSSNRRIPSSCTFMSRTVSPFSRFAKVRRFLCCCRKAMLHPRNPQVSGIFALSVCGSYGALVPCQAMFGVSSTGTSGTRLLGSCPRVMGQVRRKILPAMGGVRPFVSERYAWLVAVTGSARRSVAAAQGNARRDRQTTGAPDLAHCRR